ncbi:Fanconi anemia group A protein isoform X1 [Salarias fasciatus]|uniref:Fanconi anemia group A protein isoform X1 n=1 Tax=Salarias fasciatus TaxID=181472 RepID=UPI0011768BA4|nr:Fanconi anemia group A protein isoform X1 [Salarias fasciatus]
MKALCGWMPPQEEEETRQVQQKVLSAVVGVLVSGQDAAAERKISALCSSVLDDMLFWLLDSVDSSQSDAGGAQRWIQVLEASLCGVSASPEALQRFFTHSLTQTLTYRPQLTVSDAISLQSQWTFAKSSHTLIALLRQLSGIFTVEQLLSHLQKVLETHEVNWKHVLSFCSTVLVYYSAAQHGLTELLSRLLSAAFHGYDLENMITAFLLARQASLEGPAIFPSYSHWFKMCFGGGTGFHASSKKSLVFLLKFLSDLVPFEPPQYLKVHILHPPFVPLKHRGLLMEYVSLAKTRLADLKESVEDMGLYEDVSAAGAPVQCQAVQDVQKAVSLFETTGRISATVMEASIFRRPYFLTRFLPALLTPRVLPVKSDAQMSFIDALKKADKIPAAQYSSYVESCQRERQRKRVAECSDSSDDPLEVLNVQLQKLTEFIVKGDHEEMSAQLSRISHTLSVVFPGGPDEPTHGQTLIRLQVDAPPTSDLHLSVIDAIMRNFCQCVVEASRENPPNKQSPWASSYVNTLLTNTQLLSGLLHRLWDLFHNQGTSLSPAHILGLGAFMVHLHNASTSHNPLVQLEPSAQPEPVSVSDAVSSALVCRTHSDMIFCVRLCLSAVCYGICRRESSPQQQQQDFIPVTLYKKLLYLLPRLLPEVRRTPAAAPLQQPGLWSSVTHSDHSWKETARQLWSHAGFQQLQHRAQHQLSFSEWLSVELRVLRGEDILSDAERQEYQQWACSEFYLPRPEEDGGCGGDMRKLCSHLLTAVMDQQLRDLRESGRGTCFPDIVSRLQEVVCEMQSSSLCRFDLCDLLFEEISQRCSSAAAPSVGSELSLQRTLQTWNRVLLCLPALILVKVKTDGGRRKLDCDRLVQHVNQHQRKLSSSAALLPLNLNTHLLRGLFSAAERCDHPAEEVRRMWTHFSSSCPLLLISTVCHWPALFPVLSSWCSRVCVGESLQQLQLITDCQLWASSLEAEEPLPPPPAAPLLLAASLHRVLRGGEVKRRSFSAALRSLHPDRVAQHKQALVFLFFLSVKDFLSALLFPQDWSKETELGACTELLAVLVDSSDWPLLFTSNERSVYQSVTMATTEEFTRLMPWAFCCLLLQQSADLQQRALRATGFLQAAVSCYIRTLQLFLDGDTPPPSGHAPEDEAPQILKQTKQFLLRAIAQSPPNALSSGQLRQLQGECADVDPEVAAALSVHSDCGSPEMDFL